MAKTTAQINKSIAFMARAGAKLDAFIQGVAIDVLEHYMEHSDVRMVNRLYTNMPKGARHAAMAEWLMLFAAVGPNTGANKNEQPFAYDATRANDLDGAKAKEWFTCKKSPPVDMVYDVRKAVMAILSKARLAKATLVNSDDALLKLAEAVGIPPSDVPTGVKIAATRADAEKLIAEAAE